MPVLPGSARFTPDDATGLADAAQAVGFPLLVKAAAGGGGIGMRRVDSLPALADIVAATQSMAGKAFGSASIYLERYVPNARHIEVQVFGFGDGTAVHLHDRECSIQRRFQKIIEEAPAPNIPRPVRDQLQASAVALAAAQRYSGAGTVEFIYDCDRESAYFLEMNTRIQVEHPVTEMITGIDLVAWQIQHALGKLNPMPQASIGLDGHAVECRLYAERPEKGFLPSPGEITHLAWPLAHKALRIDTGVKVTDRITPYYDPMIGKLIAHGENRAQAILRLTAAVDALVVEGLETNARFLGQVLRDEAFVTARVTTGFVEQFFARRNEARV
ncbi:Biotin carboxylase [compost metagenome]